MPTYIADFDYSIHSIQRVTHQLKVVEEPIIGSNKSKLDIFIVRINSGKEANGGNEALKLTVNGDVVTDNTYVTPSIPANGTQEVFFGSFDVPHNSDGTGPLNISAVYKCDYIEGWGLNIFWWTIATAEISVSLSPIDMSKPSINNVVSNLNRYGTGVSVSFNASHKSYPLTSVQLILNGLTYEQAYYRYGKITQADTSDYEEIKAKSYKLILTKTTNLSESNDIFFDLDDYMNGQYPLNSGGSYDYEITVSSATGITNKYSGMIRIPQKVTGISCESEIDLLPGQTTEFVYSVIPQNAEEKSVKFHSSDNAVATIDSNGKITAIGEGMCRITVETLDGGSLDAVSGFSGACSVTVLDKNRFPVLEEIRYLSVREITNIIFAQTFLRDKFIEKALSFPEFTEIVYKGRSHPVKEIKELLEKINSNCFTLQNIVSSHFFLENFINQTEIISKNTDSNWYITVNNWVRILNELNNLIEKEV